MSISFVRDKILTEHIHIKNSLKCKLFFDSICSVEIISPSCIKIDFCQIGIAISILGSILIVIHAPKSNSVKSFEDLRSHLSSSEFIAFVVLSTICVGLILYFYAESNGSSNMFVYISESFFSFIR